MFLSASDLRTLTGYVRPSAQVVWLRRHGYRHTVNALGEPVVAIAEFNRRMVGGVARTKRPNFAALHGTQTHTR